MWTGNKRQFLTALLLQYPSLAWAFSTHDGIGGVNRDGISGGTKVHEIPNVPTADGILPDLYVDFVNGVYFGTSLTAIDSALSRASVGWGDYQDGHWAQFATSVPIITDKGLQTQIGATNLALQCRGLSNGVWIKNPGGTTAINQIGIDNLANAASLISANAANCMVTQTVTAASALYAYSVFLKRLNGSGPVSITMDGTTWTDVTSQINSTTWSRVQISQTLANPVIGVRVATNGDQVAVDFNQLESLAATTIGKATSPILTTTGAVTRAADRFQLPLTVGSAVTIFGIGTPRNGDTGNATWLTLSDGSNTNRAYAFKAVTFARSGMSNSGGNNNIIPTGSIVWTDSTQGKLIMTGTAGDQATSFNGQAVGVNTATPFATGLKELDFGQFNTVAGWWNTVEFALWLNHRASNAELQRLTT